MDIQNLNDNQLEWLRKNFQEGVNFFVVKDSRSAGRHFCSIKDEASCRFTCQFYCDHQGTCSPKKREANFATYKCVIYVGPREPK